MDMTQSEQVRDGIPFNFNGWFNFSSGYGIAALEYACALERLTGKVSIGWERKTKEATPEWNEYTQEQKDLFTKPFVQERIGVIKSTPEAFHLCKNEIRIGYTMVEADVVGEEWVKICNTMSMLLVPSPWLVDVFKNSGVTIPIRTVRQGISVERYPYIERPERDLFTFGIAAYIDDRKNWQDLVVAFQSEFAKDEPVRLIIKNNNPKFGYWMMADDRVKIIHKNYSYQEMTEFYKMLDCFVFMSRGEGAGMPPREAMSTGLPVILADYSGLSEICNPEFNYPIKPVAIDWKDTRGEQQPGNLARYDVAEIMYWMRYVYEHQKEAKEKAIKASEWMHRDYNWDACAKVLYEHLKEFI